MAKLQYSLPNLPYDYAALEPVISTEIMQLHHDKHHTAYVTGANSTLEKLEKARSGDATVDVKAVMRDLSFNVSGHILHCIFWKNMRTSNDSNNPPEEITTLINESFGSVDAFKAQFADAAKKIEGSGWAVLAADHQNNLVVHQVEKHNLLNLAGFDPVLVLDVWEHAYYLDYKNDRGAYVDAFWKIVNWDDVANRLIGCECCKEHDCEGKDCPDGCCGECE